MHEALIAQLETELLPGSRANELICSALCVPYDNVTDRVDYTLNLVNQQTHNAVVSTKGWAHLVPIVPDGEMAEFIEGRREGEPAIALCIALLKLDSEQRAGEAEPGEYDVASDTIRYQSITAGTVTMRTGGPGDAFVLPAAGRSVFTRSAFPLPPAPAEYYGAPDAPMEPPRAARRPTGTNEDYWRPEGERGANPTAPIAWAGNFYPTIRGINADTTTLDDILADVAELGDEPNGE